MNINFNSPPPAGSVTRLNWNTAAIQVLERRIQALIEGGGGGGGTVPNIPNTQIPYGNLLGILTSNPAFLYDSEGESFAVGFGSELYMAVTSFVQLMGDVLGTGNGTAIGAIPSLGIVEARGYTSPVASNIVFTGPGLDDMSNDGGFSGPIPTTYSVSVDGRNVYTSLLIDSMTGTASIGDIVTGTNTGATGTIALAGCGDPGCKLYVTPTSGDFTGETDFTVDTGAFGTLSNTRINVDTFEWGDGISHNTGVPMDFFDPNELSDGQLIVFASDTGHTIGSGWTFDYSSVIYGNMMRLDGVNRRMAIGDVDGILGGLVARVSRTLATVGDQSNNYFSLDTDAQLYRLGLPPGKNSLSYAVDMNTQRLVYNLGQYRVNISGSLTGDRERIEPDQDGTYAMLSDIPAPTVSGLAAVLAVGATFSKDTQAITMLNGSSDVVGGWQDVGGEAGFYLKNPASTEMLLLRQNKIRYGSATNNVLVVGGGFSGAWTHTLPDKSGTYAMLDDVPVIVTGLFSVTAGALDTTFVFAHGLGYTPSHVNVTAKTAGAALPHFVTWDGTNITVTTLSAPGAVSVIYSWESIK